MMRAPGTLIFDLDGTLSDPSDGIFKSTNHALITHGHPPLPLDGFDQFIGPPIDMTFRNVVAGATDAHVTELVSTFRDRYGEVGYAENTLYDGITPALHLLHGAGLKMGVCTSKRRDFAVRILEMFDITRFFDFVDGGDVGIRKANQLRDLLEHGLAAANAVMIGDRASDIEAAKANRLASVGVLWGFGSAREIKLASPDTVVDTPSELGNTLAPIAAD